MFENGVDHAVFLGGGGVPVKMTDEYFLSHLLTAVSDGAVLVFKYKGKEIVYKRLASFSDARLYVECDVKGGSNGGSNANA